MSSMNIDQPLEDVIKAKRQQQRNSRKQTQQRKRTGGPKQGGSKRLAQGAKPVAGRVIPKTKQGAPINEQTAKKIIVSNLPLDVNDQSLRELMTTTIGPVSECSISYDQKGNSKGFAQVRFKRPGDGNKAYNDFNGRLIDNNRPIKIEIVVETADKSSLVNRLAPKVNEKPAPKKKALKKPAKKRGPKPEKRTPKTAEDLDAEMEDYTQSKTE